MSIYLFVCQKVSVSLSVVRLCVYISVHPTYTHLYNYVHTTYAQLQLCTQHVYILAHCVHATSAHLYNYAHPTCTHLYNCVHRTYTYMYNMYNYKKQQQKNTQCATSTTAQYPTKSRPSLCSSPLRTYPMQLVVETAGVADRFPLVAPSPQSGGSGVAVGAGQAHTSRSRLEWPILYLLTSASHPHRQQTINSEIIRTI